MSNPFEKWTPAECAAHNARVANKGKRVMAAIADLNQAHNALVDTMVRRQDEEKQLKRIRQAQPRINQLEAAFFAGLAGQFPNYPRPRQQAKTFKLANGVNYTPDITASIWPDYHWPDGCVAGPAKETCWEVKGRHAFDGSLEKLKFAAHEWPEINWWLVWKDKETGAWRYQRVLA